MSPREWLICLAGYTGGFVLATIRERRYFRRIVDAANAEAERKRQIGALRP